MDAAKDTQPSRQFRNEHHKALVNLILSYNRVKDKMGDLFDQHDLTMQQFNILQIVSESADPLSTLEIRQHMPDRMSDTSRIVDRMVAKNLLTKKINKLDKRLVVVNITAKGKKLVQRMEQNAEQIDSIMAGLSVADCKQLNRLLEKLQG